MRYTKKSQVTLFIIISVVILVIFSVFMIILSRVAGKGLDTATTTITESDISYDQFNSYIESCLDNALNDGLFILGRQGGFFFDGQGGATVDFLINSSPMRFSDGDSFNITYITGYEQLSNIQPAPGYPCLSDSAPALWPDNLKGTTCINTYSHNMNNIEMIQFGYYQKVNSEMRDVDIPLCSETRKLNSSGVEQTICKPSLFEGKNKYSIQNQLENYIKYRLEQCYQEAQIYIVDYMNATIVDKGAFDVSLIFGDDQTTATLKFPLVMDMSATGTSTKSFEFYARAKVRLKTIYSLLYGDNLLIRNPTKGILSNNQNGIIDYDISNLTYDVERDSLDFINEYNLFGMSISRIFDGDNSIIKITDNNSEVNGLPYEYYVRMWNRAPALDYVTYYPQGMYDVYAYVGGVLILEPLAFDPDDEGSPDDLLTYEYKILDNGWDWRADYFHNSSLYTDGMEGGYACTHSKYGVTKNRCARIELNESDGGSHRVEITVRDNGNLVDSQVVEIYVDNKPTLIFDISHIYTSANPPIPISFSRGNVVSIEDPFILDTTGSVFHVAGTNSLVWSDRKYLVGDVDINPTSVKNNFGYPYAFRPSDQKIVHPGYDNYTLYSKFQEFLDNADYLTQKMVRINPDNNAVLSQYLPDISSNFSLFNINERWGYPFSPSRGKDSTIDLTYYYNYMVEDTQQKDIHIVWCIPYRTDTPSYPYNLVRPYNESRNINPYFGNHTCCLGDTSNPRTWYLASSGDNCYSSFEIGTHERFVTDSDTNISLRIFEELNPTYNEFNEPFGAVVPPEDGTFDLYVRELEGECTGDRGNICDPVKFNIWKVPFCGQRSIFGNYNSTIGQTFDTVSNPNNHGYYDEDLCICRVGSFAKKINKTDPLFTNKYCCSDSNGVPQVISSTGCTFNDCFTHPSTIGGTPGEYCLCGENFVNISIDSSKYCCRPAGTSLEVVADGGLCP